MNTQANLVNVLVILRPGLGESGVHQLDLLFESISSLLKSSYQLRSFSISKPLPEDLQLYHQHKVPEQTGLPSASASSRSSSSPFKLGYYQQLPTCVRNTQGAPSDDSGVGGASQYVRPPVAQPVAGAPKAWLSDNSGARRKRRCLARFCSSFVSY